MSEQQQLNQELTKLQGKQLEALLALIAKLMEEKKEPIAQVSRKAPKQQNQEKSGQGNATVVRQEAGEGQVKSQESRVKSEDLLVINPLNESSPQPRSSPEQIAEEPTTKGKPQEELLYGVRGGKPYLNMSAEDAQAIASLMGAREGVKVPNAENLIVRSADGKTLFEADSEGKVVFNIYEKEPNLINDRDFQQSSGLANLQAAIGFVKQSEQVAQVARESAAQHQEVTNTLSKIQEKVPALSLESQQGKQINRERGAVKTPQLSQQAAMLATLHDRVISPELAQQKGFLGLGRPKEFGKVNLGNDIEIVKSSLPNKGFTLQMRNQDADLVLLGSYSQQTGWSVSPNFAGSELESLLSQELQARGLMSELLKEQPQVESQNLNPELSNSGTELNGLDSTSQQLKTEDNRQNVAPSPTPISPEAQILKDYHDKIIEPAILSFDSSGGDKGYEYVAGRTSDGNYVSKGSIEGKTGEKGSFEIGIENSEAKWEIVGTYSPANGWEARPEATQTLQSLNRVMSEADLQGIDVGSANDNVSSEMPEQGLNLQEPSFFREAIENMGWTEGNLALESEIASQPATNDSNPGLSSEVEAIALERSYAIVPDLVLEFDDLEFSDSEDLEMAA